MSRALLNPIPDWLALRVACVVLSSVRPGKSRSRDDLIVDLSGSFLPARFCGRALAECGCCDGQKTFTLEQILSAGPGTVECVRALLQ